MPTYDYKCNACDHSFKLKAERAIGAGSAVIFKGSGFYQTDYRSEEYKSKAKKETESVKSEKAETKTTEKK